MKIRIRAYIENDIDLNAPWDEVVQSLTPEGLQLTLLGVVIGKARVLSYDADTILAEIEIEDGSLVDTGGPLYGVREEGDD